MTAVVATTGGAALPDDGGPLVPTLHIPGFTHPVAEHYLEDVLTMTGHVIEEGSRYAKKAHQPERGGGASGLGFSEMVAQRSGIGVGRGGGKGKDKGFARAELAAAAQRAVDGAHDDGGYPEHVRRSLEVMDEEAVNIDAIAALVEHLDRTREEGAVLVFMPGMREIGALHNMTSDRANASRLRVLPLHSSLAPADQRRVFDRPPPGSRKVVIATNIAETSITIDDIVFVVDSGRVKENRYDALNRLPQLVDAFISTANRRQRRGRAGRVRPGEAFFMYPRATAEAMAPFQPPEMLRVPLHELCLQIKLLNLGEIEGFLAKALEPPAPDRVREGVATLAELQALDKAEILTPLGHHLATLPVDVRVGKMLLFACMLRCLHPVLVIAAGLSLRSPFLDPFDKREPARAARLTFAGTLRSDHLALLKAHEAYAKQRLRGKATARAWCAQNFLSHDTLENMEAVITQFVELLLEIGFVNLELALAPAADGGGGGAGGEARRRRRRRGSRRRGGGARRREALMRSSPIGGAHYNVHANGACGRASAPALPQRCARAAGDGDDRGGKGGGKGGGERPPSFETVGGTAVSLHPASVNAQVPKFPSRWFVYYEKVRTSKIFLRDATMVSAYPLLLFGGELDVAHAKQTISVDGWIEFGAPPRVAVLFRQLRAELDRLLLQKIKEPKLELERTGRTVSAIVQLLHEEAAAKP